MKKASSIVLSVTLALSLIGCANQNNEPASSLQPLSSVSSIASSETDSGYKISSEQLETTNLEPLLNSYYLGQNSRAFNMLKKSIFIDMIEGWTGDDIENPAWNYDSFTQYYILNSDMVSATHDKELYYCTFSADDDKCGYIVLSYDGSSLRKISMVETPYLYDLKANVDEIADKLSEAGIDLSSVVASRVQLVGTNKNCSDEVIRITDGNGHNYMCCFGESSIDFAAV